MTHITIDQKSIPKITHDVGIYYINDKAVLGILDDDKSHHDTFQMWGNHPIDVQAQSMMINFDVGLRIKLHNNTKDPIKYVIKLDDTQIKLFLTHGGMWVFDSYGIVNGLVPSTVGTLADTEFLHTSGGLFPW